MSAGEVTITPVDQLDDGGHGEILAERHARLELGEKVVPSGPSAIARHSFDRELADPGAAGIGATSQRARARELADADDIDERDGQLGFLAHELIDVVADVVPRG